MLGPLVSFLFSGAYGVVERESGALQPLLRFLVGGRCTLEQKSCVLLRPLKSRQHVSALARPSFLCGQLGCALVLDVLPVLGGSGRRIRLAQSGTRVRIGVAEMGVGLLRLIDRRLHIPLCLDLHATLVAILARRRPGDVLGHPEFGTLASDSKPNQEGESLVGEASLVLDQTGVGPLNGVGGLRALRGRILGGNPGIVGCLDVPTQRKGRLTHVDTCGHRSV